nr:DUF1289 domain-containing protein [Pseudomonas sp. Leaf127]
MAKDIEPPAHPPANSAAICVSCGRNKEDIRKWRRMNRPEKMAAVQRADQRLKSLNKKKG